MATAAKNLIGWSVALAIILWLAHGCSSAKAADEQLKAQVANAESEAVEANERAEELETKVEDLESRLEEIEGDR